MIVSAAHCRLIQEGKKTRVTRPATKTLKATLGDRTPVQVSVSLKDEWSGKRTERRETRCHVIVDYVVRTQLHLATDDDARHEGYHSREEWFDHWRELYGHRPELALDNGIVVPVDVPVLVYGIRLDTGERPRFLAQPIAGRQGDYTESRARAIDDAEAVGGEWLDAFSSIAEEKRRRAIEHEKFMWKQERRYGRAA